MREIGADEWLSGDVVAHAIAHGWVKAVGEVVELGIATSEEPLVVVFASEE